MTELSSLLGEYRVKFESVLEDEIEGWRDWPVSLLSACQHSLFGGGKRVRPILAMMVADALDGNVDDVLPWAIAVEMIHTYSLIHDDLPAMDDDQERRGKPTCHMVFGEANAILAGDALLTRAFGVLTENTPDLERAVRLVSLLACSAGGQGMVAGQIHDMGGDLNSLLQIQQMQRLKTGALIRAAAEGAAIAVGSNSEYVCAIQSFGESLGFLFQLTDDILDREEDGEADGKNILNHISATEVYLLRDETAVTAKSSLDPLGSSARNLRQFVDFITHRTA
jgi:geranylgeranyl diphosphate synthase type II